MAAQAGIGGLGTFGWVAVVGGVLVAGAGGLYYAGLIGQQQPDQAAVVEAAVVEAAVEQPISEPQPDPAPVTEAAQPAPETTEAPAETETAEVEPQVEPDPPADTAQTAEPETSPEPVEAERTLMVATLDQIFIEADGATILSGRAEAGSKVRVLLNGANLHEFTVASDGQFAEFFTLPFSDQIRALSLQSEKDGLSSQSDDYVIAALPEPAPVQVAEEPVVEPAEEETVVAVIETEPEPLSAASQDLGEGVTSEVAESATQPEASAPQTEEPTAEPVELAQTENEPSLNSAATDETSSSEDVSSQGSVNIAEQAQDDTTEAEVQPNPPVETAQIQTAQVDISQETGTTETAAAQTPETPVDTVSETDKTEDTQADTPQEEPTQVAILRSGADGVELVQPAEPAQQVSRTQVALDTIGYSDAGDVQLTGRAREGAQVRVYLDNQAVSNLTAGSDGKWRGEIEGIDPGIYTLRLDELDSGGAVLSRLETPFKREAPELLIPAEPQPGTAPEQPPIRAVTVQAGDTLWAISRQRYGDGVLYVRVFEANRDSIRDPDLIYPGQIFNIPD